MGGRTDRRLERLAATWTQGHRRTGGPGSFVSYFEHTFLLSSGRLGEVEALDGTAASEALMGMPPSVYFYVARCVPQFGESVAMFGPSAVIHDGYIVPFDTGGVAQGHVRVRFAGGEGPRDLYMKYRRATQAGTRDFIVWIQSAYADVIQYVRGGVPQVKAVPEIVVGSKSDGRAWTWEVSLSKHGPTIAQLFPEQLWIRDGTLEEFKDWVLRESPASNGGRKKYIRWLRHNCQQSTDPVAAASGQLEKVR